MDKSFTNLGHDYFSTAHNCVYAAKALILVDGNYMRDNGCYFADITTQMLGQAAEIILKAALAYKGHLDFSIDKRGKNFFSHDLIDLIAENEKSKVIIDEKFKFFSKSISENYSCHDYRYSRSFYGFTQDEEEMRTYMSTGMYKGFWPTDSEKNNLERRIRNEGLIAKSITSPTAYIEAINRQIGIVSQLI